MVYFVFRKIKVRLKQFEKGHRENTFNWSTDVSEMTVRKLPSRKLTRDKDESGNLLKIFCKVWLTETLTTYLNFISSLNYNNKVCTAPLFHCHYNHWYSTAHSLKLL